MNSGILLSGMTSLSSTALKIVRVGVQIADEKYSFNFLFIVLIYHSKFVFVLTHIPKIEPWLVIMNFRGPKSQLSIATP